MSYRCIQFQFHRWPNPYIVSAYFVIFTPWPTSHTQQSVRVYFPTTRRRFISFFPCANTSPAFRHHFSTLPVHKVETRPKSFHELIIYNCDSHIEDRGHKASCARDTREFVADVFLDRFVSCTYLMRFFFSFLLSVFVFYARRATHTEWNVSLIGTTSAIKQVA